ncbi:hypothetical protein MMYC01_206462 [Madurella mycetomatis]|uniref:Uncharacterized protein n=1 Tax=Madurella mycetomatis TaxID=100816 RepID=A0A175W5I9_9PEZI|nr:hypothetical protein MMYC01_208139 [Madurella mycetomatis]KXX78234.1 hypothetical protein MMYC01_206462 [Madurella mycetomatis]
MLNISAILSSDEDKLLNGIWISLLSVEALMVLCVALRGLVGAVSSRWALTHRARSRMGPAADVGHGNILL